MAYTTYQIFLILLFVCTGSINTIITKFANRQIAVGEDGKAKLFDHPFFQADVMFVGEFACFCCFKILFRIYSKRGDGYEDVADLTKGNRNFNPLVLLVPAVCDMTCTCILYIGLNLTHASSYQMFRGSVIIFVSLLSMVVLHRRLVLREWLGIFGVIFGLTLVGLADFVSKTGTSGHSTTDVITGDIMIVGAMVIQAIQMVVEEKFVSGLDIPAMQAAGWEGIFGFTCLTLLLIPLYFIKAGPPWTQHAGDRLENPVDAFVQIKNSWQLMVANSCTVVSIAFYNFTGISVTKEISATTRMVLDSIRTVIIWCFSLMLFGQVFHWLQLIGFVILLLGMCLYNGIIGGKSRPTEDDNV